MTIGDVGRYSNLLIIANHALVAMNMEILSDLVSERVRDLEVDRIKTAVSTSLPVILNMLLEKHYWQFALKSEKMVKKVDGMYQYPSDCLRLVGIGNYNCGCPSVLTSASMNHPTNPDKSLNAIIKNDDRYISQVAFTMVNGAYNWHIMNLYGTNDTSTDEFDTLYYIHDDFEGMKMPYSFIDLASLFLIHHLFAVIKSDPQGIAKSTALKASYSALYKEIEREYEEFKSRFMFNISQRSNTTKGVPYAPLYSYRGFKPSPFE